MSRIGQSLRPASAEALNASQYPPMAATTTVEHEPEAKPCLVTAAIVSRAVSPARREACAVGVGVSLGVLGLLGLLGVLGLLGAVGLLGGGAGASGDGVDTASTRIVFEAVKSPNAAITVAEPTFLAEAVPVASTETTATFEEVQVAETDSMTCVA